MRISLMIMIVLVTFYLESNAQTKVGIKAGINTVDIAKDELTVFDADGREKLKLKIDDANYGINIGIYLLAKSKRLYIQPELIYNSNSTDFRIDTTGGAGGYLDRVFNEKYQKLDIPIMMGFRFDFFRIGAGPVGHFNLNSTSDLFDIPGYKQDFSSLELGYQAGIGIDLSAINIDLRYEGNIDRYGSHFRFFGEKIPFSERASRFIGTIGISF